MIQNARVLYTKQNRYCVVFHHKHLLLLLFSLFGLQILIIFRSSEGHSMKLMPELESLRFIYPKVYFVRYYMQHTPILGCASSNFKFRATAKNAGTFGRDLGAKFLINDPKK